MLRPSPNHGTLQLHNSIKFNDDDDMYAFTQHCICATRINFRPALHHESPDQRRWDPGSILPLGLFPTLIELLELTTFIDQTYRNNGCYNLITVPLVGRFILLDGEY